MSFPKAKVKRFNELDGCGPPVGSYDPKINDGTPTALFLRSDRFKNGAESLEGSSSAIELSAKKSTCFTKPYFPKRQINLVQQAGYTKVQECEKEIRRLLKVRSDFMKQLASKEEEMKKMEGKLQSVMRERSHFQANMTTSEKDAKEMRRANEILKMKVNTLESVSKAKDHQVELVNLRAALIEKEHNIVDLKQELISIKQECEKITRDLIHKDSDISRIKDDMVLAIKNLQEELECSNDHIFELETQKNNLVDNNDEISMQVNHLEAVIATIEADKKELTQQKELLSAKLKEYCQDLETKRQEMNQIVEDLRKENLVLLNRIEDQTNIRKTQEKFLSVELDNAYAKLGVTEDCSRALQAYRDVLVDRITVLKDCVNELEEQQSLDMRIIKELKLELMDLATRLADKEQALLDANTNIMTLNETCNELKSVRDQLQSMTEKCLQLEEELNSCDADHQVQVDKLEVEVLVTKLSLEAGEQELADLRQILPEIQCSLDGKIHLCKQLQTEIEQQKSDSRKTVNDLNDRILIMGNECSAKAEEIARLECDIATYSKAIDALTKKLDMEIEEKNKLADFNQAQLFRCSELEDQFERVKKEKLELENALKSSNALLASLRHDSAAEIHAMENKITKLTNENLILDTEFNKLQSKECVLEAQVNEYVEFTAVANDNLNKMQRENAELISSLKSKEIEAEELTSTINDYKGKIVQAEIEKRNLEESNKYLEEQKKEIENKHADQVKLYKETEKEVKEKSELSDMLNAECETIQTMFSELYEEKNNLEMEFRNLSRQLFNATESLTLEKDKCMELKGKLNRKTSDVKMLNEKIQKKEEKYCSLQTSIEEMEKQKNSLESMCQMLEHQLDDSHCNLSSFQREMDIQLATLSEQLEQVLKDKQESESLLLETKNEKNLLQEVLTRTVAEKDDLALILQSKKSEVADLQVEVDLLCNVVAEKQKAAVALSNNLLTWQSENESLKKELENKDEAIGSLKCIITKLEIDLQETLEFKKLSNCLQDKLNCATEDLQKFKLHQDKTESQFIQLQSEIESLSSCIMEKDKVILKQNSDYESMNTAMDTLNDMLKNKDEIINYVKEECKFLEESLELRYGEIAELKTVIETNHQLIGDSNDNSMIEELRISTAEVDSLSEMCQEQQQSISKLNSEKDELKNRIKQLETDVETQSAQTQWLVDREKKLLHDLDMVEADAKLKQQEYIRVLRETQKQYAQFESERYKQLKDNEGRQNEEMLQALTNEYESRTQLLSQHIEQLKKESLSWKSQFEDLQAKVAPFQEQLDAFEVERNMMMSKTNETLSDFHKLSQQYATLLGHQNHKQKIQHVCKLKEEIFSLKEAKAKLTSENMKLKKQLQRRDGGSIPMSARKFDPAKAFQHQNKENDTSLREFSSNRREY